MTDEITIINEMRAVNGNLNFKPGKNTKQFDQTTARAGSFTVEVGTTEESIDFGDLAPGYYQLTNLDATNYVQVGYATTVYVHRLLADGGSLQAYLESGVTVFVKANTAACDIQVQAIDP